MQRASLNAVYVDQSAKERTKMTKETLSIDDVEKLLLDLKREIETTGASDSKDLVQVQSILSQDRDRLELATSRVSSLQKSRDQLKNQNRDLEMENLSLSAKSEELQKKIEDLQDKYISLKESQGQLGKAVPKEAQDKLKSLQNRISTLEKEKRDAISDKVKGEIKIKELDSKISSIDKDMDDTRETFKRIASKELTKAMNPEKAQLESRLDQEFNKLKF